MRYIHDEHESQTLPSLGAYRAMVLLASVVASLGGCQDGEMSSTGDSAVVDSARDMVERVDLAMPYDEGMPDSGKADASRDLSAMDDMAPDGQGDADQGDIGSGKTESKTPWQPSMGRGLVALPHKDGVYLSWRLFVEDPANLGFNLYRVDQAGTAHRVNEDPITTKTNFLVQGTPFDSSTQWYVRPVDERGQEQEQPSYAWSAQGQDEPYFLIDTQGENNPGRQLAVADLMGRGQFDYIMRYPPFTIDPQPSDWDPDNPDNKADAARRTRFHISAFDRSGQKHWTYDMGESIDAGIWFAPFLVHDLDGDGRAELIVKAGDDMLGEDELRDESGRVMYGPEYLRIVDGRDGATILAETDWPDRFGYRNGEGRGNPADPPYVTGEDLTYTNFNHWSRHLMAIAYLDGVNPHVIVLRGTYGKLKVEAHRYAEGGLQRVWYWENEDPYALPHVERGEEGFEEYDREYRLLHRHWGQGAHSIRVGDVDEDGKDEVIIGAMALDDDGEPLWSFNRGHVDHVHLGDLDLDHEGLEIYYGAERGQEHQGGMGMVSARTGEELWIYVGRTRHIHSSGLCADMLATIPGTECYSGESARDAFWLYDSKGHILSQDDYGLAPQALYWDSDPQRERLRRVDPESTTQYLQPYDFETNESYGVFKLPEIDSNRELRVLMIADMLGDWREEALVVSKGKLIIYSTTMQSEQRHPWLMQDRVYKAGVTVGSMGYYQIPLLGYDLATAMTP